MDFPSVLLVSDIVYEFAVFSLREEGETDAAFAMRVADRLL
jgi:hypothetical protein